MLFLLVVKLTPISSLKNLNVWYICTLNLNKDFSSKSVEVIRLSNVFPFENYQPKGFTFLVYV